MTKMTLEERIQQAMKHDVYDTESDEAVPLIKVVGHLPSDTPYILAVPNPENEGKTLVIANGSEEELFHCATTFISWIRSMNDEG